MKRTNLYVVLGALAAFTGACNGETSAPQGEDVGTADWQITQVGDVASQACTASAMFDISASEEIGFIAVNLAQFNAEDVELALYTLDSQNQRQYVKATAVTASSLFNQVQASSRQETEAHDSATSESNHMDSTVQDSVSSSSSLTRSSRDSSSSHSVDRSQSSRSSVDRSSSIDRSADQIAWNRQFGLGADWRDNALDLSRSSSRVSSDLSRSSSASSDIITSDQFSEDVVDTSSQAAMELNELAEESHDSIINESHDDSSMTNDSSSLVSSESAETTVQALESSSLSEDLMENTLVLVTDRLETEHLMVEVRFDATQETLNFSVIAGARGMLGAEGAFQDALNQVCSAIP